MIPFKMKILGYQSGTYTVEYIPEDADCKPIKLNIQLDQETLHDKDQIVERLKLSSPQDFWYNQIIAKDSNRVNEIASSLINTTHAVKDVSNRTLNPVDTYSFHPIPAPIRGPSIERVNLPPSTMQALGSTAGSSTPEQVAGREEQNIIKLKILIQQVLQEMAEGTV